MRDMERFFNIAGPCVAAKHYMLPATERLPEVVGMIRRELYFVVHAPRQSGKTTALKQLVRDINGAGERVAMYCSLVVADSDLAKPWEGKISTSSFEQGGKTIHVIRC